MKKGLLFVLIAIVSSCLTTQAGAGEKFFTDPSTYGVTVNYDMTVDDLLKTTSLDTDNARTGINDQTFPVAGTGTKDFSLVLINLRQPATTKEVLEYMNQHNLQPADLKQYISFTAKFSEYYHVVTLGSSQKHQPVFFSWHIAIEVYKGPLTRTHGHLAVEPIYQDAKWGTGAIFLAVSK